MPRIHRNRIGRRNSRFYSAIRPSVPVLKCSYPGRFAVEPLEQRTLLSISLSGVPTWVPEGPAPQISAGNTIGPTTATTQDVGAMEAIAVDPANSKHLIAGSPNGGIWQTSDFTTGAPTWTTTTDLMPSLSISAIAFSPSNSNVIYAGTGQLSSLGVGGNAVGIYKSTDGGATWQVINPNGIFTGLRILRVVPTTLNGGQTVFAATTDSSGFGMFRTGGVYRSDDGGGSWTRLSGANGLPNTGVTDLVQNPANTNQFFASVGTTLSAGVYMLDLGVSTTWVNISGNIAAADLSASLRILLSVSPAGANPVWASIINTGGFSQRIYRGVASGSTFTWTPVGPGGGQAPDIYGPNNQGSLHGAIVADPTADNLVYVSGDTTGNGAASGQVVRGDSTANTWTALTVVGNPIHTPTTVVPTSNGDTTAPHSDSRALVFASGGVLICTSDGGVYQCTNPESTAPGSQTWTCLDGTIQDTEFYNVAYDSVYHVIFGGAQDEGTPLQTAQGNFTYTDQSGGDGGATAADSFTFAGSSPPVSVRYFFGAVRKWFDGPASRPAGDNDANILPSAGLSGLTKTNPNDLFTTSAVNAIAPTAAQLLAGQSTRVVISGSNNGATAGGVYESNNAGSASETLIGTKYFVNDSWTQIPTGAGFVSTSVMAYGGRSGGVDNPDVLYAASGNQIFLRTTAGGTLTATAGQPAGAGSIGSIVLDPNDWHTAFITDWTNVYMTTDAGNTWTNITGNLVNPRPFNANVAVIPGSGVDAVLFSGAGGVSRMLTNNIGVWTQFGVGQPNVISGGMTYNAADDVLVNATTGRGAWEVSGASTTAFAPGVLEIDGDTDFPGENDTIKLVLDPNNPVLLDVYLNSTSPLEQVPLATLSQINVNGLGGNDKLIVDDSNGLISVPNGIEYDGGTGFNSLQLVQSGGTTRSSDVYSVGPDNGSGTDVITDSSGTQTVFFQNLAPVLDTVPAVVFTVNATNANNAINFSEGSVPANGLITIDNFEPIEFSNKQGLTLNSLSGMDSISFNDFATPTSLALVNVNGGDPSAGDSLLVNGVAGTATINTSSQTITGVLGSAGSVPIHYAAIEALTFVGGPTNTLSVAGSAHYSYTPAVALDGGLVQTDQIPITFTGLGAAARLALNGASPAEVVNGTAGQDSFSVAAGGNVVIAGRLTIQPSITPGSLTLNGLGGNDGFNVGAFQPYSSIAIDGGAGDTANLTGNGTALAAVLGSITSVTGGGLGSVSLTGISTLNLNAGPGTGAISLTGSSASDAFVVTVGASNTTSIADGLLGLLVNATSTGNLSLDGGPSSSADSLVLKTSGAAAVGYTPLSATSGNLSVAARTIGFTDIESLTYNGQSGGAALSVNGNPSANAFTLNPGAANDAGAIAMDSTLPLSFQNLGAGGSLAVVGNGGTDSLVYNDPSANDAFTVNNSGTNGLVNLASRVPLTTSGIQTLTLNGLNGGDSFTLVPPISSSVYSTLNFNGGGTGVASLLGPGNDSIVVSGQSVSLGGVQVNSTGMQNILLDAGGGTNLLTYNGVLNVSEQINVAASTLANAGQIIIPGELNLSFRDVQQLAVNGNTGGSDTDTFTFTGTNNADLFQVNLNAAGTASDPVLKLQNSSGTATMLTLLNYTNFSTLNIAGLDGADVFNVYTGPDVGRNIFINGSIPNGKKKLTDLLNVFYASPKPKIVHSTQTQNPNSGLVSLQYSPLVTDLIQYTNIENVVIRKL